MNRIVMLAVAGLVAITPASGLVAPLPAILVGLAAGVVCFSAVRMKPLLGYDDALDVVGVHAVGGILGALATGLFAMLWPLVIFCMSCWLWSAGVFPAWLAAQARIWCR